MSKKLIHIIIADDSPTFLDGLQLILSRNNQYKVIDVCYNGLELNESEMLGKADLILSDIDMPEYNGIEAAKRINFRYPKLPLIALTMHKENVFLKDIVLAGFKGFLYKPEIAGSLYEVINKVLNNKFSFPEDLT